MAVTGTAGDTDTEEAITAAMDTVDSGLAAAMAAVAGTAAVVIARIDALNTVATLF
jgi:hypothetical protein